MDLRRAPRQRPAPVRPRPASSAEAPGDRALADVSPAVRQHCAPVLPLHASCMELNAAPETENRVYEMGCRLKRQNGKPDT